MDRTRATAQLTAGLTTWAIDFERLPSDSVVMEKRSPDWKGRSWIPYCWAISIFACSRLVVAVGLVFSQKYLTSSIERWSAGPLWYHQLLQWDSEWYFKIVTEGYRYNGETSASLNISKVKSERLHFHISASRVGLAIWPG